MGPLILALFSCTVLLISIWFLWPRFLASCLTLLARRSHLQLSIDTLGFSGGSGIILRLNKGLIKELTIKEFQLNRHSSNEVTSWWQAVLSGAPCVRLRVSGVSITLADKTAAEKLRKAQTTIQGTTPLLDENNMNDDTALNTIAAAGASPSLKPRWIPASLFHMVIFEVRHVSVVDETSGLLSVLELVSAQIGALQQEITLAAVTLGPIPGANDLGAPFLKIQRGSVQHQGPLLSQLAAPFSDFQLHTIAFDVGDTALDISDDFMRWMDARKAQRKAIALGNTTENNNNGGARSNDKNRRAKLAKLGALLPTKVDLNLSKIDTTCSMYSLRAGGSITGCSMQLSQPLHDESPLRSSSVSKPESHPGPGSARPASGQSDIELPGALLGVVTLGWQQIYCNFGTSTLPGAAIQGSVLPPPALSLQCSSTDLCLQLAYSASTSTSARQMLSVDEERDANALFELAAELGVNEMHTNVHHEAIQPTIAAMEAALQTKANIAVQQQQQQPVEVKEEEESSKRSTSSVYKGLIGDWQCSMRLGQGSSLRFLDSDLDAVWWSNIDSAKLAVSKTSKQPLGLILEAADVNMHVKSAAVSTVASTTAQHAQQQQQLLAMKTVQLQLQPTLEQGTSATNDAMQGHSKASFDAIGLSVLLQPHTLATVATVVSHLVPASGSREQQKPVSGAVVPPKRVKRSPEISTFDFTFSDAVVSIASSVAIPKEHSSTGNLHIIPGTVVFVLDSIDGGIAIVPQLYPKPPQPMMKLQGSNWTVAYCEGLAAQRFHSEGSVLLGLKKSNLLQVNSTKLSLQASKSFVEGGGGGLQGIGTTTSQSQNVSPPAPSSLAVHPSIDNTNVNTNSAIGRSLGDSKLLKIALDTLVAVADADGIGCLLQAADDLAGAAGLLKNATKTTINTTITTTIDAEIEALAGVVLPKRQRSALQLELLLNSWCVSLPLSADLEVSTEARAVELQLNRPGAQQLQQIPRILLKTQHAALKLKGARVVSWDELSVVFQKSDYGLPSLPVPLLPQLSPSPSGLRISPSLNTWGGAKDSGLVSRSATPNSSTHDGFSSPAGGTMSRASSGRIQSSLSTQYVPYARAKLGCWIPSGSGLHRFGGTQSTVTSPTAAGEGGSITSGDNNNSANNNNNNNAAGREEDVLGSGPRSVVDVTCSGLDVCLPHDREPGGTERYMELYIKAASAAFIEPPSALRNLRLLLQRSTQPAANATTTTTTEASSISTNNKNNASTNKSIFPMQLNVTINHAALRFEHHPMEAWLATHGPVLQRMAVQQHSWSAAAAAIHPTDTVSSPLHAGIVESTLSNNTQAAAGSGSGGGGNEGKEEERAGGGSEEAEQAWQGIMKNLSRLYIAEARKIAEEAGNTGDLFSVSFDTAHLLLVICGTNQAATDSALSLITTVDPSSQGVALMQARKLHLDVIASKVAVKVATMPEPLVAADRAVVSGVVGLARQVTAPPRTAQRTLPVGMHRRVPLNVTVRGYRAPFKFYTDVNLDTQRLTVCYTPALEPTLSLLGMAGKRLSPSDPDKTAARPPPVPWWDDLRYFWRGRIRVRASPFNLTLSSVDGAPAVDEFTQRLEISAAAVEARLPNSTWELSLHGLQATLFKTAGIEQGGGGGGNLLTLPFIQSPAAVIKLTMNWVLPGGRSSDDHHLFPKAMTLVSVPGSSKGLGSSSSGGGEKVLKPVGVDRPVVVADVFKAEQLDLGLDITFSDGGSGIRSIGYLGDQSLRCLKEFIKGLRYTAPYQKAAMGRGTFFVRKPRGGPPKKGLPRLLQKFVLNINASPLDLIHHTLDPGDPSSGLCVSSNGVVFESTFMLNQPLVSFLTLPPHIGKNKKSGAAADDPASTKSQCLFIEVNAQTVRVTTGSLGPIDNSEHHHGAAGLATTGAAAAGFNNTSSLAMPRLDSGMRYASATVDEWPDEWEESENTLTAPSLLWRLMDTVPKAPIDRSLLTATSVSVIKKPLLSSPSDDQHAQHASTLSDVLDGHTDDRPLRVSIHDARFFVDLAGRDAVWSAVVNLFSGFSSSPLEEERKAAGGGALLSTMSVDWRRSPSPFGGLAGSGGSVLGGGLNSQGKTPNSSRRNTATHGNQGLNLNPRSYSQMSENVENNELLSLLLQQGGLAGNGGGDDDDDDDDGGGGVDSDSDTAAPRHSRKAAENQRTSFKEEDISGEDGDNNQRESFDFEEDGGNEEEEEDVEEGLMSTPLDDVQSTLKYEVLVTNLQVNLQPAAEEAQGRLLLAAKSGALRGLSLVDTVAPLRITTLTLDQVQAYVAMTDVDPHAAVAWLEVGEHGFMPSSVSVGPGAATLRRVFNPIRIDLRHSKIPVSAALTTRRAVSALPSVRALTPGGFPGRQPSTRGEELVLKIPEIAATMDGREFEVVADAVSLLLTPGPRPQTIRQEELLLLESENEHVEDARQLFCLVRQQLTTLSAETGELRQCLGQLRMLNKGNETLVEGENNAGLQPPLAKTNTAINTTPGAGLLSPMATSQNTGADANTNQQQQQQKPQRKLSIAVVSSTTPRAGGSVSPLPDNIAAAAAAGHVPIATAMREVLAGHILAAASSSGSTSAMSAASTQHDRHALLLLWLQEQEAAARATYFRSRTGLLKIKREADAGKKSMHSSRVLVQLDRVVWQLCTQGPSREPFVQAALRGLSLDKFRNRDHSGSAKFIIHRLDIKDATGSLQASPGTPPGVIMAHWNPDSSYEREPVLRLILSMGVPAAGLVVYDHIDATLHPMSVHLTEAVAVACWEYFFPKEDTKQRQEAFAQSVVGTGKYKRVVLVGGSGSGLTSNPPQGGVDPWLSGGSPAGSPMAASSSYQHPPSPFAASAHGHTGSGDFNKDLYSTLIAPGGAAIAVAAAGGGGGGHNDDGALVKERPRKRFVYVKLNRAHFRITYEGYPISIRDKILVVNSYTCENLEGRWRDLLGQIKSKAILSAVWSGLGLQNRKIKELLDPTALPSVHMSDDGRGAKGFFAKMGLAPKPRKEAGGQEMDEEGLKAMQKRRALFGDHRAAYNRPTAVPVPSSATSASAAASVVSGGVTPRSIAPSSLHPPPQQQQQQQQYTATASLSTLNTSSGVYSATPPPPTQQLERVRGSGGATVQSIVFGTTPPTGRQAYLSPLAQGRMSLSTDHHHQQQQGVVSGPPPPPPTASGVPGITSPQHQGDVDVKTLPTSSRTATTVDAVSYNEESQSSHTITAISITDGSGSGGGGGGDSSSNQDRSRSTSPLKAGAAAVSVGGGGGGGSRLSSNTSSPQKESATALLGQAYHQQQQKQQKHDADATAQLLGIGQSHQRGGGAGAKAGAQRLMQGFANKVKDQLDGIRK